MFERERPHPRHSGRCGVCLENAADGDALGEHVIVVIVPLAGWATKRRALQEQVVFVQSHAGLISPSLPPPLPQFSPASRLTAGASAFFILSQLGERPER